MLRLLNVSPGRRVEQAQTSSPKTALCLLSTPVLYLMTHRTTTTIITLSDNLPLTQPPSSQAPPATGHDPQASPALWNTLCLATTPPPLSQSQTMPQHPPAPMEAPYPGLKLFSLRPLTTFLPRAEWVPPTSPVWEVCPLWFLHRIKLVLSSRAEVGLLFRAPSAGTNTGNDWIWRWFSKRKESFHWLSWKCAVWCNLIYRIDFILCFVDQFGGNYFNWEGQVQVIHKKSLSFWSHVLSQKQIKWLVSVYIVGIWIKIFSYHTNI